MKTSLPLHELCFQRLFLLPGMLAALLLTGCSSEKRDRLWQTLDPAGYKHAHSESFNGSRALRAPESRKNTETGDIPLDLDQ
ncbi:hypothetical protein [Prosthecobacter sp.]|uniref:hypothetical protein n=1 Tax=Prosthecobacter sp. TaxID=1965333 RepID=UPI00248A14B1|nr:hypothetical protein [Prosthecobacter sp.]MDI1312741.1 hypothetical protein [Prosthecobacter sp.]